MPFLEDERISVALSGCRCRIQICLKSGKDCRQATCQSCSMLFIAAISGCPVCLSPHFPLPIAAPPTSLHATRKIAGETNATSVIFTSVLLTSLMDVPPPFFPHPRERKYAHTVFFDLCRDIWHRPLFFYGAKEEEKRDKRLAIRIKVDGDSDLRKIRKNRRMLIDWYFFLKTWVYFCNDFFFNLI